MADGCGHVGDQTVEGDDILTGDVGEFDAGLDLGGDAAHVFGDGAEFVLDGSVQGFELGDAIGIEGHHGGFGVEVAIGHGAADGAEIADGEGPMLEHDHEMLIGDIVRGLAGVIEIAIKDGEPRAVFGYGVMKCYNSMRVSEHFIGHSKLLLPLRVAG